MRVITLFLLLSLMIFADSSIDAQIEAIRKAPVEKRFKMMNAFKRQIVKMREQERIEAIHKLRHITNSKHGNRALQEIRTRQRAIKNKTVRSKHIRKEQHTRSIEERAQRHTEERIENHIEDQTEEQIESQVESQIESQAESQIESQVEEGVENEIENQMEDGHDDN